jgi:hypothetical protein
MCQKFVENWASRMNFDETGWIINASKERTMVVFNFNNGRWYMSSGIIIANRNEFKVPTKVYIYYQLKRNNLLMFDATLGQFAPPYEVPCDSHEHPFIDFATEHVDVHEVDVEGIDVGCLIHFDVKIISAMSNTNQLLVSYL